MSEPDLLHQLVVVDIPREQAAAASLTIEDVPGFLADTNLVLLLEVARQLYEVRSMVYAGFTQNKEMLESHEERLQIVEDPALGESQLTEEDAALFNRICMALQGVAESIGEQPNVPKEQVAFAAQLNQLAAEGLARIEEIALPAEDDEDDEDDEDNTVDNDQANSAGAEAPQEG